jgi:hypothetical protein
MCVGPKKASDCHVARHRGFLWRITSPYLPSMFVHDLSGHGYDNFMCNIVLIIFRQRHQLFTA